MSAVLAVLFMTAGLASADVYNNNDIGYSQGEQGVGSTYIQCFSNLHRAYFTVEVWPTLPFQGQTLSAKVDSYKWNGQKREYDYYSTSGWQDDASGDQLYWAWWGGIASGYWIHHVYYRWSEPNGQWTTRDEWISSYRQWVNTNTSYTAQYCTT